MDIISTSIIVALIFILLSVWISLVIIGRSNKLEKEKERKM